MKLFGTSIIVFNIINLIILLVFYISNTGISNFIWLLNLFLGILGFVFLSVKKHYLSLAYYFCIFAVLLAGAIITNSSEKLLDGGWYPSTLLQPELINMSNTAILISLSSILIGTIFIAKTKRNTKIFKKSVNIISSKLLGFYSLGIGLLINFMSARTDLSEQSYASGEFDPSTHSSFTYILGIVFISTSIFFIWRKSQLYLAKAAFIIITLSAVYFNLFRGDRDGTLLIFIVLLGAFWTKSTLKESSKLLIIVISIILLYLTLDFVGDVRGRIASQGLVNAVTIKSEEVEENTSSIVPVDKLGLLPMMYWHCLGASNLVQNGNTLKYQSFKNLGYQFLPSPVTNSIGLPRPPNVAWKYEKHYAHGGGFFIVAEALWNGGIFCVLVFFIFLGCLLTYIENWFYKQDSMMLGFYFGLIGSAPTCVYYSMQGMFRWIEVWVIFALFYKLWHIVISKN